METKSCKAYRDMAWNTLTPHWNEVAICALVIYLISILGSGMSVYEAILNPNVPHFTGQGVSLVVSLLVIAPLSYAFYNLVLGFIRQEEMQESAVMTMVHNATGNFTNYVVSYVLMTLVIVLLLIPTLCIGSIIFSLAYAMVPFVLKDHPEYTPKEALRASRMMMRGHKGDLFLLALSFIGWFLLGILSFGIAFIWIYPYMNTAVAHFYEDIKPAEEANDAVEA